jgi:glycosyltransferase involved in cell wall biosynthesis
MNKTLPGRVQSFMASRKPIIVVANGETQETIENAQCGWVVPAGDAEALEKLLRNLILLPDSEFHSRAQSGFNYYSRWFERSSRCRSLIEIVRSLLKEC